MTLAPALRALLKIAKKYFDTNHFVQILNGNDTALNITDDIINNLGDDSDNNLSEGGLVKLIDSLDYLLDKRRNEPGGNEDFTR